VSDSTWAKWFRRRCERYGPHRLLGVDRADVGAGCAFATSAVVGGALASAVLALPLLFSERLTLTGTDYELLEILLAMSVGASVVAAPVAFLAGAALWRRIRRLSGHRRAAAGKFVGLGVYVGTTVLFPVFAMWADWLLDGVLSVSGTPIALVVVYAVYGVFLTLWLTIPVGAVGAVIHRRAGLADA